VENTKLRDRLYEVLKLSGNRDEISTDDLLGQSNSSESVDADTSEAGSVFDSQVRELRGQLDALQSQVRKLEAENKTLIAKASIQRASVSADKSDGGIVSADSSSTKDGVLRDPDRNEIKSVDAYQTQVFT
jgi:hypothetical protein